MNNYKSRALSIFALLTLLSISVWAQTPVNTLISNGPYGGYITVMAVSPVNANIVFVGTESGGLYKSINKGQSWSRTALALQSSYRITGIAVSSSNENLVYTSSQNNVFKSTDGGTNWKEFPFFGGVDTLVINPLDDNILYAASLGGLFKSSNGGESWESLSIDSYVPRTRLLSISLSAPNTLLAALSSGLLYKTTDGGSTWKRIGEAQGVLLIDPTNANTFYAANYGGDYNSFFKSTDGGETWEIIFLDVRARIVAAAIDPLHPNTLYFANDQGTVYKSTDAGKTWDFLTSRSITTFAIDPSSPSVIYSGNIVGEGIYKSVNSGETWKEANQGLTALGITVVVVHPTHPKIIYAGGYNSSIVYKSTDGGSSWTVKRIPQFFLQDLVVDPINPNLVYVATKNSRTIFKSTDGGDSWDFTISPDFSALSLAIDPSNRKRLYAGTGGRIIKSTDRGDTWNPVNTSAPLQEIRALALDPFNSDILYASSFPYFESTIPGGLFKSTDGGTDWIRLEGPVITYSIAIDDKDSKLIYTASGSIFKSTDAGNTLKEITSTDLGLFLVQDIVIAPSDHNILYAGTAIGSIFRSSDKGETWSQLNPSGRRIEINSLAVDPLDANTVYAGTQGGSVTVYHYRPTPRITCVFIQGKHLMVAGENFVLGSQIYLNGERQKTNFNEENPSILRGKNVGKKISVGQTVTIEVHNPEEVISEPFSYTRSS